MLLLPDCLLAATCAGTPATTSRPLTIFPLRLDIVIWLVCSTTAQPASMLQLLTALCCASGLLALAVHRRAPAFYMGHRTAITAARRVLTLPYIRHAANKKMNPRGPVAAVVLHLLVQSGALHNFAGSLFFLDGWRVGRHASQGRTGLAVKWQGGRVWCMAVCSCSPALCVSALLL